MLTGLLVATGIGLLAGAVADARLWLRVVALGLCTLAPACGLGWLLFVSAPAASCRRRPEVCDHDLTGRPGLGAPRPTDGYRPVAALDRYTRARDRHCRFPGF